jgi:hypothetical protein
MNRLGTAFCLVGVVAGVLTGAEGAMSNVGATGVVGSPG